MMHPIRAFPTTAAPRPRSSRRAIVACLWSVALVASCGTGSPPAADESFAATPEHSARITEAATISLVARPPADGDRGDPLVEITEWVGPVEEVGAPPEGLDVAVLHCGTRLCEDLALYAAEGASDVGWTTTIDSLGQDRDELSAIAGVLVRRPDVFVAVGLDGGSPPPSVGAARQSGVITVSLASRTRGEDVDRDAYSIVVDDHSTLVAELAAHAMIAGTAGTAEVAVVPAGTDSGAAALATLESIIEACAGCSLTASSDSGESGGDLPGRVAAVLASSQSADFVVVMAEGGMGSVGELFTAAAGPRLVVLGGDESSLELVEAGLSPFHPRVSSNWLAYAAIDGVVRTVRGRELSPEDATGLGARLFVPGNLPTRWGAEGAFFEVFDWALEYLKMWGMN